MTHYHHLTASEHERAISLRMQGVSARQIAKYLGRGAGSIDRLLQRSGLDFPPVDRRKATPDQEKEVLTLWAENVTRATIMKRTGLTEGTIRGILRRHSAPHGKPGRKTPTFSEADLEAMVVAHRTGTSISALANRYSVGIPVIKAQLKSQGVEIRLINPDGQAVDPNGYVRVRVPKDHPHASMAGKSGYIFEHRLRMAEHLGRSLTRSETVHHINGERADNRIENLQLRQGAHGKGIAQRCGDCGSSNILEHIIG